MYVGKIRLKIYSAMMVFSHESVSPEGWFTVVYISWDGFMQTSTIFGLHIFL